MKTQFLAAAAALTTALTASAVVVPIDLGPPRLVKGDIFVTAPAAMTVSGQTLSLDYEFSDLLYLFDHTNTQFAVAIRAQTNMLGAAGEYQTVCSVGYFVGLDGYQGPTITGFSGGLFGPNVTEILFGLTYAMEFIPGTQGTGYAPHPEHYLTGMHFDLTLPDLDGIEISGLELHFQPGWVTGDRWAVRSSVPDTGSTALLLGAALATCALGRGYYKRRLLRRI